jgi:hypothetical protein
MNFLFILFVLVSIMSITGAFYFNYVAQKSIQAVLLGTGLIIFSIYFGLRWFRGGEIATEDAGTWPPSINSCPDFLSLMKVNDTYVCVDPVGVSNGGMEKWTDTTQTDPKYLFNLSINKSGAERIKAICDECKTKKVTWEGVWNGSVCLDREPPIPRG